MSYTALHMYEKVLQLVKDHGPSLPVEISGKLNINSFLAKAYMEELVGQGKLVAGEKIGVVNIFYAPGQEELAKKRAEEIKNPVRTVGGYVGKDLDMSPEAVAKRENFKKHFQKELVRLGTEEKKKETPTDKHVNKIIADVWETEKNPVRQPVYAPKVEFAPLEKIDEKLKELKPIEIESKPLFIEESKKPEPVRRIETPLFIETPKKPERAEVKPVVVEKRVVEVRQEPKVARESYVDKIIKMLDTDKARVIEKIDSGKKNAELVVEFPSSIGAMRFYVEIKDKKAINKADVSLAYTEGLSRKLPSMILTNGKLAKPAEAYAESLGSLFKLKQIN